MAVRISKRIHLARNAVVVAVALTVSFGMATRLAGIRAEATTRRRAAVQMAPRLSRSALKAEIDRRWPEIQDWRAALAREYEELQVERQELEALRVRIEGRRRQYEHGLSPTPEADDQSDARTYAQRMETLQARTTGYNVTLAQYQKSAAAFDKLVLHYNSSER